MKKLRDNPIAMRSAYTSVFMAAARDVIDTTEAAPNTMPDSVRSERNLCPRISRHASPISSSQSRIAQRLDGREPRRAHRREHAGDQAYAHRSRQRNGRDERTHHRRHLHEMRDDPGQRCPKPQAQGPANHRDDQDLGEHVGEDPARGRAEAQAVAESGHPRTTEASRMFAITMPPVTSDTTPTTRKMKLNSSRNWPASCPAPWPDARMSKSSTPCRANSRLRTCACAPTLPTAGRALRVRKSR